MEAKNMRMIFCFFVIISLSFFAPSTEGSYMCTGIHTWFNATYGNSTQTLLHYETDILYTGSPKGYETLSLANSHLFTYNSSYNAYGIQQESYPQQEVFTCNDVMGNCSLIFADGNGLFNLGVKLGNNQDWLMMADVAYFRGTVFWEIGLVLTPDNGCVETFDFDYLFPNYNTYGQYCCNRWEQLPEAPTPDNICQEFTSNIEYYNSSMSLANLTMKYYFDTGKNITVIGKSFTSPLPSLQFDHNINYAFQDCKGTLDNPIVACVAPMEFNDAVYAFYADVTGYTQGTWHAIAGAVEYRFGQLMRNGSDPFTPQNSCYSYSFDPSVGGTRASVSNSSIPLPPLSFNADNIIRQYFDLPYPVMCYILQSADPVMLRKLYRTCKYFYNRMPYCIIENIDLCGFLNANRLANKSNIWVTNVLHFARYYHQVASRIVRCDAKEIRLPTEKITTHEMEALTYTGCLKTWDAWNTNVINEDGKIISCEEMMAYLPNAVTICARVQGVARQPSSSKISIPATNKIKKLILEVLDETVNVNMLYDFLTKVLAPKAVVELNFPYEMPTFNAEMKKKLYVWRPQIEKPTLIANWF